MTPFRIKPSSGTKLSGALTEEGKRVLQRAWARRIYTLGGTWAGLVIRARSGSGSTLRMDEGALGSVVRAVRDESEAGGRGKAGFG